MFGLFENKIERLRKLFKVTIDDVKLKGDSWQVYFSVHRDGEMLYHESTFACTRERIEVRVREETDRFIANYVSQDEVRHEYTGKVL